MNLVRGKSDETTYLVRQGQKEVVEEDGGGRNYIVLATIARS